MKSWLKEGLRVDIDLCFDVYDISEHQDVTDRIKSLIANEILKAFRNPMGLKKQFQSKAREELQSYIKNELFSQASRGFSAGVRVGDWGEVFAGLYLVNLKNNDIPLYKIRYKARIDKSVQMLDLLTIDKINNTVNFNEVKTKTTKLNNKTDSKNNIIPNSKYHLAIDAYKELFSEYSVDTPQICNFIAKILYDSELFDLADKFDQFYKENKCNKKANIFLLFDKQFWKEEVIEHLNNHEINIEDLCVHVILINDLRTLIEETYGLTLQIAENIVYE